MLHRVVLKRSGRPSPEASALGFTAAHHLICVIVGKPVIAAGYYLDTRCWIALCRVPCEAGVQRTLTLRDC